MPEFFSSDGFMPHGHCYLWQPALVWLHLVSDVLIALAYTTIPFTLVYFIRKRRDVPFRGIFLWFGLFIVSCGATHLFEAWNLYHADYWPAGLAKAFTALASLTTAFLLVRTVPEALRLPAPAELRAANEGLRESEARYRAVFEGALDAIFVINEAGRYVDANPAAAELLGYSRAELLSMGAQDVTAPDKQDRLREALQVFSETGVYAGEYQLLRKDGLVRDTEFRSVAHVLPGMHVAIARDVTERKRLEVERQALLLRLMNVQEEERRSIARELHDEVGQLLTGLRLMLDNSESSSTDRREEMKRVVNELIGRVRDLSMDLRPPMLDELGVLPTLLWQIERFEKRTAISVEFRHANLDRRFSPHVELTAVRVVQEALTNVAKHAGVATARVEVWASEQVLGARVEDRGSGFDVPAALRAPSSGLSGMRERCRLLHGRLEIESTPGTGTRLVVELPAEPAR
jgi:PAS domain S-box-containing protein